MILSLKITDFGHVHQSTNWKDSQHFCMLVDCGRFCPLKEIFGIQMPLMYLLNLWIVFIWDWSMLKIKKVKQEFTRFVAKRVWYSGYKDSVNFHWRNFSCLHIFSCAFVSEKSVVINSLHLRFFFRGFAISVSYRLCNDVI